MCVTVKGVAKHSGVYNCLQDFIDTIQDLQHEVEEISTGSPFVPTSPKSAFKSDPNNSHSAPWSSSSPATVHSERDPASRNAPHSPDYQHGLSPTRTNLTQHAQRSSPLKDEYYLRVMADMLRISHVECETPLEYVCPLTHQLMHEPVVLLETGHSYERKAIEEWWGKGNHFCPRTGADRGCSAHCTCCYWY
jgi:U-box domain